MSTGTTQQSYRVLARKYRPADFSGLIGQDALVRTLSNAIESGRLAHAWLLTGVRGVGKTTTARILARALNCIGADGSGDPTISPCGVCEHCLAIAEDRHVDVIEMDAASRTGVDDIREVIEGVRYRPVSARYKVYIIDEIHMLSKNAFNALLKTLEEPPPHVKFIFATTEVRKVPVTVVSRCQRFDLRRIEAGLLLNHLEGILAKESVEADADALALVARAADGSVRDSLSIIDQAIAHCGEKIDAASVRDMLGLADRERVFDLFEAVMGGRIKEALDELARQYEAGVDPVVVAQDLLELTHWLTRVKVVPEAADAATVPEAERRRGRDLAGRLSMPVLTRTWQMLLKGLGEARSAPDPLAAVEMALVRLSYVADLPAPADLVTALRGEAKPASGGPAAPTSAPGPAPGSADPPPPGGVGGGLFAAQAIDASEQPEEAPRAVLAEAPARAARPRPTSLAEVVALAEERREMVLVSNLRNHVRLVRFEPGRMEFGLTDNAPGDFVNTLREKLSAWTGERWVTVVVSNEPGEPTLSEQENETRAREIAEASEVPLVKAVLETFPDATVTEVRPREAAQDTADSPADEEETPEKETP